jgi:hypothetical protein
MRRAVAAGAVLAAALAGPAVVARAAGTATIDVAVIPSETRFGEPHHASGRMLDAGGAPLAGRRVALQARDYPFTGPFRSVAHATTGLDGTFSFDDVPLDRNADLRVVAFDGTTSGIARAWTYPKFTLHYRPAGMDKVVLTQSYRTPRDVRLTSRTLFFLGSGDSVRSSLRVSARTRRTGAGRFVATARVKLPSGWHGSFRYASCFRYTPDSGMGDPSRGCPRRFTF